MNHLQCDSPPSNSNRRKYAAVTCSTSPPLETENYTSAPERDCLVAGKRRDDTLHRGSSKLNCAGEAIREDVSSTQIEVGRLMGFAAKASTWACLETPDLLALAFVTFQTLHLFVWCSLRCSFLLDSEMGYWMYLRQPGYSTL